MMRFMPVPSHQTWRYRFQALWLLIFAGLVLAGAGWPVWAGLLVAGLVSALLVKRAACSFVCPIFPVGELLWRAGARWLGRNFTAPFWFDLVLRTAKYLVLAWVVIALSQGQLPDTLVGAQHVASLLVVALLLLSLFFQMPWCRYLCPYGALLGLVSMASLLKIRRSPGRCVRCHRCDHRCPANLPVMLRTTVRSPECFACYRCVDGCPAPGALDLAGLGANKAVPAWLVGLLLTLILLSGFGITIVI
jgi:polyferredoxin